MTTSEGRESSQGQDSCPPWCIREHHDSDHPEDRVHQAQPIFVPAITRATLLPDHPPQITELMVMAATDGTEPWIVINEDEGPLKIAVDLATALGLTAALHEILGAVAN